MPSLDSRRSDVDPTRYTRLQSNIPNVASMPPMPDMEVTRSPIMLASLPGVGSGPDAVLRQFNGGRRVPKGRLLVP